MLKITVSTLDGFDETTSKFVVAESVELELEHSLFSLAKWESRECKPFINKDEKSADEMLRYIQDMDVSGTVTDEILQRLSPANIEAINAYINAPMTATSFREMEGPGRPRPTEIVTAEIMYHWLIALQIPFEVQHWHLNRLITQVRVCNEKNKPAGPKKKMTRSAAAQRAELNRQRMAQTGSRG